MNIEARGLVERNVSIIHLSRLLLRFIGEKERVKLEKFESFNDVPLEPLTID